MFSIFLQSFILTLASIIPIGAQNAFVLKQGLLKQHILIVCLICCLCDLVLMTIGVFGLANALQFSPLVFNLLVGFSIVFLVFYGSVSFYRAITQSHILDIDKSTQQKKLSQIILITLSVTLLNPHVYLDTVIIVGTAAEVLAADSRWVFLFGAICAAFSWFFFLGYACRLALPLFQKPITWRLLDAIIGLIMFQIAGSMGWYWYSQSI